MFVTIKSLCLVLILTATANKVSASSEEDDEEDEETAKTEKKDLKLQSGGLHSEIVQWFSMKGKKRQKLPLQPVSVGKNENNEYVFVGRAHVNGELIPGKYLWRSKKFTIPYRKKEKTIMEFEVLLGYNGYIYLWKKPGTNQTLPRGSILGGYATNGDTYYICSVMIKIKGKEYRTPGKLHQKKKICHVPTDKKEVEFEDYSVLSVDVFRT